MIKRSGVEVVNARTGNVSVAKETIKVCKDKKYTAPNGNVIDISIDLDYAIKNTKLYSSTDQLDSEIVPHGSAPTIEVVNETTAQAAARLLASGKDNIVALNFASARNQGGGFLSGAIAQEEDLCRCSGLYPCLKSKPVFYNENILCDHSYYTDNIIYSPNVPFFRDQNNSFIDKPFLLSLVSAPAPNVRAMDEVDDVRLTMALYNRMLRILKIMAMNGHQTIILGAWGCGAFGNSPIEVATLFEETLKKVRFFNHICFAVYDTRTPPTLFNEFKETFL